MSTRLTTLAIILALTNTAVTAAPYECIAGNGASTNIFQGREGPAQGKTARITIQALDNAEGTWSTSGQLIPDTLMETYKKIIRPRVTTQRRWTVQAGRNGDAYADGYDYYMYQVADDRPLGVESSPRRRTQSTATSRMTHDSTAGDPTTMTVLIENVSPHAVVTDLIDLNVRAKLSLNKTNIDSSGNATLDMPLPPNEYQDVKVTYTAPTTMRAGVTHNGLSPGTPQGNLTFGITGRATIECIRTGTQLAMTLGTYEINFGSISHGSTAPVTRELTWSINGGGQANRWVMRFDNPATQSGAIMLGGGKVTITDGNGGNVAPNTDLNIAAGTSGKYTFELDPTDGQPGAHSTNVLITLTAN